MPQCCGLFIHKIIDSETKKCSIIYANEYVCVYELLHYDCVLHHSKPFCNALITAKNKEKKSKKIKIQKEKEREFATKYCTYWKDNVLSGGCFVLCVQLNNAKISLYCDAYISKAI